MKTTTTTKKEKKKKNDITKLHITYKDYSNQTTRSK